MVKRILIVAGGTGGHVFPALAIARELKAKNIEVFWLGTKHGMESSIVTREKIPFYAISISGLRKKKFFHWPIVPFQIFFSFLKSFRVVLRCRPDVILGMGGYVAGPVGLVAFLCRKKLIIHEQNTIAGLTNKILSLFAFKILTGFPEVKGLPNKKIIYVGNPVRSEILKLPLPEKRFTARENEPLHLLVLGGSQGAKVFNEVMPEILSQFDENQRPLIWHIAGKKHLNDTQKKYEKFNLSTRIEAFVDNMVEAYDWADLVICRAGASTVAEIAAVGVTAIFVPFPHAVDDHQTLNASFLVSQGAALLISQKEFTTEAVFNLLTSDKMNKNNLLKMANKAYQLRAPDALSRIIKELING